MGCVGAQHLLRGSCTPCHRPWLSGLPQATCPTLARTRSPCSIGLKERWQQGARAVPQAAVWLWASFRALGPQFPHL